MIVLRKNGKVEKKQQYWLVSILVITVLAFSSGFANGFTAWDDIDYLLANPMLKDVSVNGLKNIFTSFANANYHPLTTLSNLLEFQLFGMKQGVFFAGNLLLHLLNTFLVFRFVFLLSKQFYTALITALFFGIHPLHVESVTWLSERKDVLYAFFFLLSLIFYLKYKQQNDYKHLIYCFVLFCCSLLSKSAAVVLPLVMLLIDFYASPQEVRKYLKDKIPFLLFSFIFGIVAIKAQASGNALDSLIFGYLDRFFLVSYSLVFYIFKAFLPFNLSALHPYPEKLTWVHYISPVLLSLLTFLAYSASFIRKEIIFGGLFFIINLVLVLQFVPIGQAIVAERYTYMSYIGLFFIVGQLYSYWAAQKSDYQYYLIVATVIFALFFTFTTWQRNRVWKDQATLFADVAQKYPRSYTAYLNLGNDKQDKKDFFGAVQYYDKALAISPKLALGLYNRGTAKYALQDWNGALADFEEALKINEKNPDIWNNLAGVKFQLKDYQGAIVCYGKVIALDSNFADVYRNRGMGYFKLEQLDKACADWHIAADFGNEDVQKFISKYCK
ncbi:MAG: tetratricopeptide repeat protein [Cytophagales bacterium]|nr:MAG: tetratricopeptide repeat protein [Cytophagales bacterium]